MTPSTMPGDRYSPGADQSFKLFYELMPKRVNHVLLVSSSYDAFIMDEDGRMPERIIHEYRGLNLTSPPRLTWVSTAREALDALSERRFDMVVTMPRLDDMDSSALGKVIKESYPTLPVFLLVHDISELPSGDNQGTAGPFDHTFVWTGNTDLLVAMVKAVEDRQNAPHDTRTAQVRVIIFVEDSPIYSASILPVIYREIVTQTQAVMDDALNEEHRILRMRARPKILLANSYEAALDLYRRFSPYLLSILSDFRFPRQGVPDPEAGLALLQHAKKEIPDLPLLALSSEDGNRGKAEAIPADFLNKESPVLRTEIRAFFVDKLGFGDFFFRQPDGTVIARVGNLQAMENSLHSVPDDSILFHARQNSFSSWLMARSEIHPAARLLPIRAEDFRSASDIRAYLIKAIREARLSRQQGTITDFTPDEFDPDMAFVRLGKGSLGGKARGLAFIIALLRNNPQILEEFGSVSIGVPKTLVITTDGFDQFIRENILEDLSYEELSDAQIKEIFSAANLPEDIQHSLASYLKEVAYPLAIRSSSLFEDARNQPCAGLYDTYMLPNSHPDFDIRLNHLLQAIKLVYASTFLNGPRTYIQGTQHRIEDEKMAVIIQELTGREEAGYYYPAVSGVAQSYNYYPISQMSPEEGIIHMALGFGRTVVEGETALRFSPTHPELLPQFSSVDDILQHAQRSFYAMDRSGAPTILDLRRDPTLTKLDIDRAKDQYPVRYLSSTYNPQDHMIRDYYQPTGVPVMTFAGILKHGLVPLPQTLSSILQVSRKGMAADVEMEFTLNLPRGETEKPALHLLQIRPMPACRQNADIEISSEDTQRAVLYSDQAMGNSRVEAVTDMVYIDPDRFEASKTTAIASEISAVNRKLVGIDRKYLLVGPGRWGSADRWLGIPVTWNDISGVCGVVEVQSEMLRAEPSQGSHFFHNLMASGISYITVGTGSSNRIDWGWLGSRPTTDGSTYIRRVAFDPPLVLKVDGLKGVAVLIPS